MDETTALIKFDSLAHKIARHYFERSQGRYDYDDLYQAARLGIVSASRTFKPDAGFAFITHAWTCAKNNVRKHMRDEHAVIKVPITADASTAVRVVDSETASSLLEFAVSNDDITESERSIVLAQAISDLPEKQRDVIQMIYYEGMTFEEVAPHLGVSRQYVHTLMTKGLSSLKTALQNSAHAL